MSVIRQINCISDRLLTEQKLHSLLLPDPDDISRKLLSGMTNQMTVSVTWLWFTASSLLPSCLYATHGKTTAACDQPATARADYLISQGPCHRRIKHLSSWHMTRTSVWLCMGTIQRFMWKGYLLVMSLGYNYPMPKYHTYPSTPRHTMGDVLILAIVVHMPVVSCQV